MKILISGSTGLIGSALVPFLRSQGHMVVPLVRGAPSEHQVSVAWNPAMGLYFMPDFEGFDVVINLSGENIASARWTEEKKKRILESRVNSTHILSTCLAKLENPPKVFINASAVGYYGDQGSEELTEESGVGQGFLADVCKQWEDATRPAQERGIRTVMPRFGVVLAPDGGALAKMLIPFKLGFGGALGSGKQYMSWISIDDLLKIILFIINDEILSGPVNVVSPNPVTNAAFTKILGKVLNRPTFLNVPEAILKLIFGEMAEEMFLNSIKALPKKLLHAGYTFSYPDLEGAIRKLLNK